MKLSCCNVWAPCQPLCQTHPLSHRLERNAEAELALVLAALSCYRYREVCHTVFDHLHVRHANRAGNIGWLETVASSACKQHVHLKAAAPY